MTTTGYGDLQDGSENQRYTARFGGTSSASPIVVGALGCVQGIRRVLARPPLTPAQARTLLRGPGSPQQAAPGKLATQRIGNRPNLRHMVDAAAGPACFDPNEIVVGTYHRPITVTVGLEDCWFGNAVPGRIKIINPDGTWGEFDTNAPFTFTFKRRHLGPNGETGEWAFPEVSVTAQGYGNVGSPFTWVPM